LFADGFVAIVLSLAMDYIHAVVELFKIVVQGGESSLFWSVETLSFLRNFPQITA